MWSQPKLAAATRQMPLHPMRRCIVQQSSPVLAVTLLDSVHPEAPAKTAGLCSDASDAVASAAWQQLFRRKPELLVEKLAIGRTHRDAFVRMTAARVIGQFPTPERLVWLSEVLSDVHIEVRNVARQMLVQIVEADSAFRKQVVGLCSDFLKPDSTDWQGIEQALLVLGQLRATQFSPQCVELLDHARNEVFISAAWLIQLFPDDSIRDRMLTCIEETEKRISTPGLPDTDTALKQAHLLNYAGLVRLREIQPILETKFSKTAPGGYIERSAAMWALGILFERNPVPELAAKFEERIKDRQSVPPEYEHVRRMSVLALGIMRATASIETVREAYRMDPGDSLIPGTARWVLPLLNDPLPAPVPPNQMYYGGWRIQPVDDP